MKTTLAQQAAIDSNAARIVCSAGPGSGKTEVLVQRIRRLIAAGTEPRRIVAITFTNAAAREIEERLATKDLGEAMQREDPRLGYIGTLHGFALRILREFGRSLGYGERVSVISPESAEALLAEKARSLGCKEPIKKLLAIKAGGDSVASLPKIVVDSFLCDLRDAGLVDFDILLEEAAKLCELYPEAVGARYEHLLVDEVQDSSPTDWRIYRALAIRNKFFVGDSDQAIYGFRGGAVQEMVRESTEPGTELILLSENFRSRPEICAIAQRLIEHNANRIPKPLISVSGPGGRILSPPNASNEGEEIAIVSREIQAQIALGADPNEIAVIGRTNAIVEAFSKTLAACHIPVRRRVLPNLPKDFKVGRAIVEFMAEPENNSLAFLYLVAAGRTAREARSIVQRAEIAGCSVNKLEHLVPPYSTAAGAARVLFDLDCSREMIMLATERLKDLPADASPADLALVLAAPEETAKEEGEGVHCLTIHGAKGREFDAVFIVGLEDETIPGNRAGADIEEERRLLYVAITRARAFVGLSYCRSRVSAWGAILGRKASRFLGEIGLANVPKT